MPKGKPKNKHPSLYSSSDEEAKAARKAAPQAKPHKRGGIHRVKDEHLTGTKWDNEKHVDMIYAATKDDRYIPFFKGKLPPKVKRVKDLQKHVLLRMLGDAERELERRAQQRQRDLKKQRIEAERRRKAEEEKKEKERKAREEDRRRRINEGQIVSSSSEPESETENQLEARLEAERKEKAELESYGGIAGRIIHDDSDDETSDSTIPSSATVSPVFPPPKLRIYEWGFPDPPQTELWKARSWPHGEELRPRKLPYQPLNVVSTNSKEMLQTPGHGYKQAGVEPDAVPSLSEHVKDCARNGVLIGPLEDAVIESGTEWAERTTVQGWNGRMYFNLPERNHDDTLQEVYLEWKSNEKRKERRAARKPYAGVQKVDPRLKAIKRKEQRKLVKNVYNASEWRPTVVYAPVYLGAPRERPEDETAARECSLENLFYIRLDGQTLPHFFFWADPDEWSDPEEPNPDYQADYAPDDLAFQRRLSREYVRVKKQPHPRKFLPTVKLPRASRYKTAVWSIERDIYNHGLEATMHQYHNKWLAEGKHDEWAQLTKALRIQLPPSGRLPPTPPVRDDPEQYMVSIAEKMARVEVPSEERPILPIFIEDDWTRDDDAYWRTVERLVVQSDNDDDDDDEQMGEDEVPKSPQYLSRRISDVFNWISRVSSPASPYYPFHELTPEERSERQEQELGLAFDIMMNEYPPTGLRHDIWEMMQDCIRFQSLAPTDCAICFEDLGDDMDLGHYEQHLMRHVRNMPIVCPFCNMDWRHLNGDAKADHVLRSHRVYGYYPRSPSPPQSGPSRRATPQEFRRLAAIPGRRRSDDFDEPPRKRRRSSVVRFSPKTVGQRTAYSDVSTTSTRRASTRSPKSRKKDQEKRDQQKEDPPKEGSLRTTSSSSSSSQGPSGPRKSALKIDTGRRKRPHGAAFESETLPDTGRRLLHVEMSPTEYLYRDAHDPRRRSSSASLRGGPRDFIPYMNYIVRPNSSTRGATWSPRTPSGFSEGSVGTTRGASWSPRTPSGFSEGSVTTTGRSGTDAYGKKRVGEEYGDEDDWSEQPGKPPRGKGKTGRPGREDDEGGDEGEGRASRSRSGSSRHGSGRSGDSQPDGDQQEDGEEEENYEEENYEEEQDGDGDDYQPSPSHHSGSSSSHHSSHSSDSRHRKRRVKKPAPAPPPPSSSHHSSHSSGSRRREAPPPRGSLRPLLASDYAQANSHGRARIEANDIRHDWSFDDERTLRDIEGAYPRTGEQHQPPTSMHSSPPGSNRAPSEDRRSGRTASSGWPGPGGLYYGVRPASNGSPISESSALPEPFPSVPQEEEEGEGELGSPEPEDEPIFRHYKRAKAKERLVTTKQPSGRRSSAPSPSLSLTTAAETRRRSATSPSVPPNTPAPGPDEGELDVGELSDRIGGVKTTRKGTSREAARSSSVPSSKRPSKQQSESSPDIPLSKVKRPLRGRAVPEAEAGDEEDSDDRPLVARRRRTVPGGDAVEPEDEARSEEEEEEEEEDDDDDDEEEGSEPPAPKRKTKPAKKAKKPAKRKKQPKRGGKRPAERMEDEARSEEEEEVDEEDEEDDEPPAPKRKTKPAKKAKKPAKRKKQPKRGGKKPAKRVPDDDDEDDEEPPPVKKTSRPRAKRKTEAEKLIEQSRHWF